MEPTRGLTDSHARLNGIGGVADQLKQFGEIRPAHLDDLKSVPRRGQRIPGDRPHPAHHASTANIRREPEHPGHHELNSLTHTREWGVVLNKQSAAGNISYSALLKLGAVELSNPNRTHKRNANILPSARPLPEFNLVDHHVRKLVEITPPIKHGVCACIEDRFDSLDRPVLNKIKNLNLEVRSSDVREERKLPPRRAGNLPDHEGFGFFMTQKRKDLVDRLAVHDAVADLKKAVRALPANFLICVQNKNRFQPRTLQPPKAALLATNLTAP